MVPFHLYLMSCDIGQVRKDESNISRLRHQYGPVLEEMLHGRSAASMVIVEHMDWSLDRKRHAHCILLHSATWNIMLVVWSTEMVEGLFRYVSMIRLRLARWYACRMDDMDGGWIIPVCFCDKTTVGEMLCWS